jgi:hypothetical protein
MHDLSKLSFYWESGDYVLYNRFPDERNNPDRAVICNVRKHTAVVIEDDEIALAIKQRMLEAGVPVLSELPPNKTLLQRAAEQLSDSTLGPVAYANAYNEIRAMVIAGRNVDEIENRITEILQIRPE